MAFDLIIAGAGISGSEAALTLANLGYKVKLLEMRPKKMTPCHTGPFFAELVCSNSLKSTLLSTGHGLLKKELELYGSHLLRIAYECRVPSGGALAVDRELFSKMVTEEIEKHPNIQISHEELEALPAGTDIPFLIATGPLTSDSLAKSILDFTEGGLYFADAISPIIASDSIDFSKGFFQNRYNKSSDNSSDSDGDYFNIPLSREEYYTFYNSLIASETTPLHHFEELSFFEGCMPIEEIARRGERTLAFGPMKPVGFDNFEGSKPYAVIQLRKEDKAGTSYNIVGFQTKMTIPSQQKLFRSLPCLENAEFLRYGSVHRNTYIRSPLFLNHYFNFKANKNLFISGQITGLEGYTEAISSGLIAAYQIDRLIKGEPFIEFPKDTALGCLSAYIAGETDFSNRKHYSPSNFHLGMLPPLEKKVKDKRLKKEMQSELALDKAREFKERL